jgi:HEAT repeat protein
MSTIPTSLRRIAAGASLALALWPGPIGAQNAGGRVAVEGRIAAHVAQHEMQQALAAYDAYVSVVKTPDVDLLRPVALAELRRVARTYPNDPIVYPAALERLARGGDGDARQALRRAASGPQPSAVALGATVSLVRLEEKDAEGRLGDLLKSAPADGKVKGIRAVEDANARSQAAVVAALLDDSDVTVRVAAARAVGVLQHRAAIPQLRALMERDVPVVRMFAAPALKRLGDPSADAHVAKMLASESPEMRLAAAQAYPRTPRAQWVEVVKQLRADRDPLARVRAAEVLACCDPATARAILNEALADPVPPMRIEAARVYEVTDLADAAVARRLLGDSSDLVRLHGAGAVLRLLGRRAAPK